MAMTFDLRFQMAVTLEFPLAPMAMTFLTQPRLCFMGTTRYFRFQMAMTFQFTLARWQ